MSARGYVDGSALTGETRFTPDVLVVGSGAGGAVTAAVLAAAGLEVLVVEEGGRYTREHFRMREDTAFPQLYQEDGGRSTADLAIAILQGRSVGGSTTVNWTTCFRTPEDVVEHWRRVHGVAGFTYAELVPHWEAAEKRLSITKVRLEHTNRNNRTLYDGCRALGYEVDTTSRNVRGCLQTGYCGMGCPIDAKQSMLVTYVPDAVAKGATVLSRCRLDRLELDGARVARARGTLLGADDRTPTGGTVVVEPKRVVLAAGAIGTPAILLRSGFDAGGRVGRRTFLHPTIAQFGIYAEPVDGHAGAPQSVASHHFAHRGDEVGFWLETSPVHPMLAAMAAPGIGEDHLESMRRIRQAAGHIALLIDGFHPDEQGGRVKLRASGAPLLDYPIPDRLFRAMREAMKELAKIQLASGAVESRTTHDPPAIVTRASGLSAIDRAPFGPNRFAIFSAHVMGGAALGDDASRAVVASDDFRVHGLEDVHVVDGSLFPTSLGVNPQLSIYGLAHLAAARLASRWKA